MRKNTNVPAIINPTPKDKLYLDRIQVYRKHRNQVGEAVLRAALRAHASLEAVDMVNDILERKLSLNGVSVDRKAFTSRVEIILQIEVGKILANNSKLSKNAIERIVDRTIAQILPTRDNILPTVPRPQQERLRIEDLEKVIAREMRRTAHEKK
jgi:hypothetical protein